MEEIVFQWLGTAGFRIEHAGRVVLIDPYVTRNERSRPVQALRPADLSDADLVFLSHGHFDHLLDVPAIVDESGAEVFCSTVAGRTLEARGVPRSRITVHDERETLDLGTFSVSIAPGKHIRFDARLVLSTVRRAGLPGKELLERVRLPCGPVLAHSFDFGGVRVVHMGSLGLKPEQAYALGLAKPRPDILMPPLQGHTDICRRAALLTAAIRPRAVVPQHHDDFFPPISRAVDVEPFRLALADLLPGCAYYEPEMNRRFTAGELLSGEGGP